MEKVLAGKADGNTIKVYSARRNCELESFPHLFLGKGNFSAASVS